MSPTSGPRPQTQVVTTAICLLGLLSASAGMAGGWRQATLCAIGFGGGFALYHASFGFTSAWRGFIEDGRSIGLRAQLVMLGTTIVIFFPLLAHGSAFGQPLYGYVNDVGLALAVGAFLFGVGMQLGGGCGSGTLYTVGGGSARMFVTLAAFIAGSLLATAEPLGWRQWPGLGAFSIVELLGAPVALAVAAAALAVVYRSVGGIEARRRGHLQTLFAHPDGNALRGPWPVLAGAFALAAVNIATLLVAGRPWGITSAFALWGGKIAQAAGIDVAAWPYWQGDASLSANVLADVTTVMDLGLMLGALTAAGLAGRYAPSFRISTRALAAAVLGGLLMGVGARMATGCNIGALFSGLASGSLHGAVWLLFAVPGNMLGVRLRPMFGL